MSGLTMFGRAPALALGASNGTANKVVMRGHSKCYHVEVRSWRTDPVRLRGALASSPADAAGVRKGRSYDSGLQALHSPARPRQAGVRPGSALGGAPASTPSRVHAPHAERACPSQITVNEKEPEDAALRRFRRACGAAKIVYEVRRCGTWVAGRESSSAGGRARCWRPQQQAQLLEQSAEQRRVRAGPPATHV